MKKLLLSCLILFPAISFASYYVGVEGGIANTGYNLSWNKIVKANIKDHNWDAKLYIGYAFNPNFSLEAGYDYFNKPSFTDNHNDNQYVPIHDVDLDVVVKAPVLAGFGLYAKGGLNYIYRGEFDNHMPTHQFTENLGAGITYQITKDISSHLGYTSILKKSDLPKMEVYNFGVDYTFNI